MAGKEGTYASSNTPQTRDVYPISDLGLTLLPGSQVRNKGTEVHAVPNNVSSKDREVEGGHPFDLQENTGSDRNDGGVTSDDTNTFHEPRITSYNRASSLPVDLECQVLLRRNQDNGHGRGASKNRRTTPEVTKETPKALRSALKTDIGSDSSNRKEDHASTKFPSKYLIIADTICQDFYYLDDGTGRDRHCLESPHVASEIPLKQFRPLDFKELRVLMRSSAAYLNLDIPWTVKDHVWSGDKPLLKISTASESSHPQVGQCRFGKVLNSGPNLSKYHSPVNYQDQSGLGAPPYYGPDKGRTLFPRKARVKSWTSPFPTVLTHFSGRHYARVGADLHTLSKSSATHRAHSPPNHISSCTSIDNDPSPALNVLSTDGDYPESEPHSTSALPYTSVADNSQHAIYRGPKFLLTSLPTKSPTSKCRVSCTEPSTTPSPLLEEQTYKFCDTIASASTHKGSKSLTTSQKSHTPQSTPSWHSEVNIGDLENHQGMAYFSDILAAPACHAFNGSLQAQNDSGHQNVPGRRNYGPLTPPESIHSSEGIERWNNTNHNPAYNDIDKWHTQKMAQNSLGVAELQLQLAEERQRTQDLRAEKAQAKEIHMGSIASLQHQIDLLNWQLQYKPSRDMAKLFCSLHAELLDVKERSASQSRLITELRAENVRLMAVSKRPFARERSGVGVAEHILQNLSLPTPAQSPLQAVNPNQAWQRQSGSNSFGPTNPSPYTNPSLQAHRIDSNSQQVRPSVNTTCSIASHPLRPHDHLERGAQVHPDAPAVQASQITPVPTSAQVENSTSVDPSVVSPTNRNGYGSGAVISPEKTMIDLTVEDQEHLQTESTGAKIDDLAAGLKKKELAWLKGYRPWETGHPSGTIPRVHYMGKRSNGSTPTNSKAGSKATLSRPSTAAGLGEEDVARIHKEAEKQKRAKRLAYQRNYRQKQKANKQADPLRQETSGVRKPRKGARTAMRNPKSQKQVRQSEQEPEYQQPMEEFSEEEESEALTSSPAPDLDLTTQFSAMQDVEFMGDAEEETSDEDFAAMIEAEMMKEENADEDLAVEAEMMQEQNEESGNGVVEIDDGRSWDDESEESEEE